MLQVSDVQSKLSMVIEGGLGVRAFYEWLISASRNMQKDSGSNAINLVAAIKILFGEYDERMIERRELLEQLSSLINPVEYFPVSLERVSIKAGVRDWRAGAGTYLLEAAVEPGSASRLYLLTRSSDARRSNIPQTSTVLSLA
jgi:hypothetical protein